MGSEQKKPVATLTFGFYENGGLATKIDFDEKNIKVMHEATLIPIYMAKHTQGLVADLLEGGTFGELVATQVKLALRVEEE